MSVVPLTIEGDNKTVVQRQQDFDVEGEAALIMDLDVAQLEEERASNVSYDLRVGKRYRDHREGEPREIPEGGLITLYPGSAIIIETEENIHLPRHLFGIIAPKVKLLENGLSTTFSKVDPGYYGHLLITLFNLGQTVRQVRRGSKFCALALIKVAPGARLYEKGPQQLPARIGRRSLRELLEAHHVTFTIILTGATLLLAAVTLFDAWVHIH
jgi:dCTP deaminase